MPELKIEELEHGEIYHCSEKGTVEIIFKFDKATEDPDRPLTLSYVSEGNPEIGEGNNFIKNSRIWVTGRNCRVATEDEKQWLNDCIIADKLQYKTSTPKYNKIDKHQSELKFEDFFQGQKFTGKIRGSSVFGQITIENGKVYLCQDKEEGNTCLDKQGYDYSYVISNTPNTITFDGEAYDVSNLELEGKLEDKIDQPIYLSTKQEDLTYEDFYDGQRFEGIVRGKPCKGKITIQEDRVFLCQDVVEGSRCNRRHGYSNSYRVTRRTKTVSLNRLEDGFDVSDLKVEVNYKKLENDIEKSVYETLLIKKSLLTSTPAERFIPAKPEPISYIQISELEDPADERLMMNYMDDLSFIGFSKKHEGPIFKLKKDRLPDEFYETLREIGGKLSPVPYLLDHGINEFGEADYTHFPIKF